MKKKPIIIGIAVVAIIAMVAILSDTDVGRREARSHGYKVERDSVGIFDEESGREVPIDHFALDNGDIVTIISYESEETAREQLKSSGESLKESLALINEKTTETAYLLEDEEFYYLGAQKGVMLLQATVSKDNLKDVKEAFEKFGCKLP